MTAPPAGLSEAKAALLQKYLRGEMAKTTTTAPSIPRRTTGDRASLSFAQERQWFLEQWEPGAATYNVAVPLRLTGALDVAAMERAINAVVARHEALRTTFVSAERDLAQVIAPSLTIPLPVTCLQDLPMREREAAAQRLIDEEARRPFDLARGPLLRARALRLAEAEHLLLLNLHHIVADGWSLDILLRELAAS